MTPSKSRYSTLFQGSSGSLRLPPLGRFTPSLYSGLAYGSLAGSPDFILHAYGCLAGTLDFILHGGTTVPTPTASIKLRS